MKGLLLKDWYMLCSYCKYYLFIIALFWVDALISDNLVMNFMIVLFLSLIPTVLYSYDEREKWTQYSATLPYSRFEIVSVKYIDSIVLCCVGIILSVAAKLVRSYVYGGSFIVTEYISFASFALLFTSILSLGLPLTFRFGAEKGRIIYIFIGALCGASGAFAAALPDVLPSLSSPLIVVLAAVILYAVSWALSIILFRKREI